MESLLTLWEWLGENLIILQILIKIVVIVAPLMLCVAYFTYAERKLIGYMQVRIGPNRVGPKGWLQPIADAVKLMFKEIVIPTKANKTLFLIAPLLTLGPALAAWAVFPFDAGLVLADLNAGLADGDTAAVIQDGNRAELPVVIDINMSTGAVKVPAGVAGTESLGAQFGEVTLEKV